MTDEAGTWERFWAKVRTGAPKECWPWTAAVNWAGYGWFKLRGRQHGAHRVAYELCVGPIPPGLWVLHACDNPPCVNPAHLYAGTREDNAHDMVRRGRTDPQGGENSHNHKLTAEQVRAIRGLLADGFSQREVGRSFSVTQSAISGIHTGLRWGAVA